MTTPQFLTQLHNYGALPVSTSWSKTPYVLAISFNYLLGRVINYGICHWSSGTKLHIIVSSLMFCKKRAPSAFLFAPFHWQQKFIYFHVDTLFNAWLLLLTIFSPFSEIFFFSFSPGVGVILVTVSGAAWRMTAPGGPPCLGLGSTVDLARCGRRPCNSRGAPHGLLYPEFQHRPPPPSYQASMQEYRLR